jgi:phosphoesterase RecJ-like protein
MNASQVLEEINKGKKFLVAGHIDPDGDTITSTLLMGRLLKYLKKNYALYIRDSIPEKFSFLAGVKDIKQNIKGFESDTVITLDAPNLERVALAPPKARVINIDHHQSNERFGDVNWLEVNSGAACLMAYKLLHLAGAPLGKEEGEMVFTGLFTETGGFVLPNISAEALRTCADVMEHGVDASHIAFRITARDERNLALLGEVLATLKITDGIATIELTEKMLDDVGLGQDEHDSDSFIRYPSSIPGIKVAIFFREMREKGVVRMSFRSLGGVDVDRLASCFGGGGHPAAAGARLNGSYEEVKKRVLEETKRYLACEEG